MYSALLYVGAVLGSRDQQWIKKKVIPTPRKPPVWWGNTVGSRQWLYRVVRGEIKGTRRVPWLGLRSRRASWPTRHVRWTFWKKRRRHSGGKDERALSLPERDHSHFPERRLQVLLPTQRKDNWAGSCQIIWDFLVKAMVRKGLRQGSLREPDVIKGLWVQGDPARVWQAGVAEQSAGR